MATERNEHIKEALSHLNEFTHSFCMDEDATKLFKDPKFRCSKCEFSKDGKCLVKIFNANHNGSKDFGCMTR